jgi:hypothetical protein
MVKELNARCFCSKTIEIVFSSPKGIDADLYLLPRDVFGGKNKDNECFNEENYAAEDGLQNISPCQYGELLLGKYDVEYFGLMVRPTSNRLTSYQT